MIGTLAQSNAIFISSTTALPAFTLVKLLHAQLFLHCQKGDNSTLCLLLKLW